MSEALNLSKENPKIGDRLASTIKKYALEAIWLKNQEEFKNHISNLNSEIATLCGKNAKSLSLNDINRVLNNIESKSEKLGLGKIKFDKLEYIYLKYQSLSPYIDVSTIIYSVAMAIKGNPGPIIRKLFIKTSNKVNAKYVALTYIMGQVSSSLYSDGVVLESISTFKQDPIDQFDPIFKLLTQEHIKDLSKLLKITIDINTPIEEARIKIINEINYHASNKVKYIYNKTFSETTTTYNSVLLSICTDLKLENLQEATTNNLESKIVMRILQDSIDKLSDTEKEEFERKLSTIDNDLINKEVLASGGSLAVILGLKATGFGAYVAASSALGALSNGLGITFAFSTYTTMSSVIAGFLGPVGIGAAALGVLTSLSLAKPKKIIPAIIYIAMIRSQLESEELLSQKRTVSKTYYILILASILTLVILALAVLKYT